MEARTAGGGEKSAIAELFFNATCLTVHVLYHLHSAIDDIKHRLL